VKLSSRWFVVVFAVLLAGSVSALAAPVPGDKGKEKEKDHDGQQVDSGSFGVFMKGQRVGTETFSIYQGKNGSVTTSEFKTDNAPTEAVQTSEMQLTGDGSIRRYEWKELSPEKASSLVLPNDQFLNQKSTIGPQGKEQEQAYLLSPSTSILDDYFFIHRELLAWKFLGATCKKENNQIQCPLKQRTQFGTMNPHQHSSAPLTAEYMGREKLTFKGNQQEFNKVQFKSETGTWFLWLNDQFKVERILIESDNTDVIRD
jgi:hypothetical protein